MVTPDGFEPVQSVEALQRGDTFPIQGAEGLDRGVERGEDLLHWIRKHVRIIRRGTDKFLPQPSFHRRWIGAVHG